MSRFNSTEEWATNILSMLKKSIVHRMRPTLFCLFHNGGEKRFRFDRVSCDEGRVAMLTMIKTIIQRTVPEGYILVMEGVECLTFVEDIGAGEGYYRFSLNAKGEIESGTLIRQKERDSLFVNLRYNAKYTPLHPIDFDLDAIAMKYKMNGVCIYETPCETRITYLGAAANSEWGMELIIRLGLTGLIQEKRQFISHFGKGDIKWPVDEEVADESDPIDVDMIDGEVSDGEGFSQ